MDILTFTSLYPNAAQPRQGLFVEKRLLELVATHPVSATVVAPVPWYPAAAPALGPYATFARVPRCERRRELPLYHPRYVVVPKLSWRVSPHLMFRGAWNTTARLFREKPFALIDAHFFYPDGVAAVMLGRRLGVPVCITARGSDINLMTRYALPRRYIRWAAMHAAGLITVSDALRRELLTLGVADERITVLRNGVDLRAFTPIDPATAKAALGVSGRRLVSVGNLVALKGHELVVEALRDLPGVTLAIIGDGPERAALEARARDVGVADRVTFVGAVDQSELPLHYAAADALVLASSREGWANVLLESMACGTPVVATAVGGNPEVVADRAAGVIVRERSGRGIAAACRELFANGPDRAATRRYAERFDWDATSAGQFDLFERAIANHER